ncbi:MAG TPA: tetratricopeptide repeat protein, partial [Gemmatimonadales bacterium]|nr:tetratricopeptide repeat protein [Gemmatimonadales bacterium]
EAALRRGRPARVLALFGVATLAVAGAAFGLTRVLGLPDWVWVGALGVMLAGLPVMLYTSRVERRRATALTQGTLRFEPEPAHHGWFTWRRAVLGGALALGGLALLAAGYAGARALGIGPGRTLVSSGVLGHTDRLVLADFTSRTSDTTLGPSITEALRVDLGQSKVVRLLGARDVAAARARMLLDPEGPLSEPAALDLARREGAKAVIAGEVGPLGSGFVLTARVIETGSGQERVAVRETARDPGELLPALDRLSTHLRERVGESLKSIRASEPLENVTTGSLEALRVYTAAVREFEAGRQGEAIPLLERAVTLDTTFAMAWRKLAVAQFNLGLSREREIDATRRAYELRRRLPPIERHLAEARYFERVERKPDRVMAAYRAVLDFDPDELTALNNLGLALNARGRWGEAETLLRRAIEVHRARRTLYDNLHDAVVAQGKWAAAESVATWTAERLHRPGAFPQLLRIREAQAAHDHLRAESLAAAVPESIITSDDRIPLAFSRVDALEATGRLARSEESIEGMARQFWDSGRRGTALELALARPFHSGRIRGDRAAASREVAAALVRFPLDSIPPRDRPYLGLAGIYAELGLPADVARMHAAWEATTPVAERSAVSSYFAAADAAWARQDLPAVRRALEGVASLEECAHCGVYQLGLVLDRLGETDSALVVLERAVTMPRWADVVEAVIWDAATYERLGQLYDARGDRAKALAYYGEFVELWRGADPDLQPRVRTARARMAELAGEQQ